MLQGLLPLERPARRLRHGDDRDEFALGPHHRDRLPEDPSRRPPRGLGAAVSTRAFRSRPARPRSTGSPTRTWRTRPGFATPPPSSRRSWRAAISRATTSPASTCPSCAPSSCARASRSRFRTGGSSTRSASSSRGSRATSRRPRVSTARPSTTARTARCADAEMTLRVFAGQLARYAELPRSVAELHELFCAGIDQDLDPEGRFRLVNGEPTVNFGKNRGRPAQGHQPRRAGVPALDHQGRLLGAREAIARKYLPEERLARVQRGPDRSADGDCRLNSRSFDFFVPSASA